MGCTQQVLHPTFYPSDIWKDKNNAPYSNSDTKPIVGIWHRERTFAHTCFRAKTADFRNVQSARNNDVRNACFDRYTEVSLSNRCPYRCFRPMSNRAL